MKKKSFDLQDLKMQIDLLALAERYTSLRRAASTGGGEWAGPCPFCGGVDRFRVQPRFSGGGRWLCRGCSEGKWQDAIAFGQRLWPGLSFQEVCAQLGGGRLPLSGERPSGNAAQAAAAEPEPSLKDGLRPAAGGPAYTAPGAAWQAAARAALARAAHSLWEPDGAPALAYLRQRGLKDETLRYWKLGWWPGGEVQGNGENQGVGDEGSAETAASRDHSPLSLYIPRGVLLPCAVRGEIWYLKVCLLPGQEVKCPSCGGRALARQPCSRCGAVSKYRGVKGNRPAAIFGADELGGAQVALFVEGEFDALIAWQELNDVMVVCTLGSAGNQPDLATWGAYLAPLELILAAYDADEAGRAGAKRLQALSERVRLVALPAGAKDINDFVLRGGQLWPWLKAALAEAASA